MISSFVSIALIVMSFGVTVEGSKSGKCLCNLVQCINHNQEGCTSFGRDVCDCCTVCKRRLGEKCGGPYDIYGVCEEHLVCVAGHFGEDAFCRADGYGYLGLCYDRETGKNYRKNERWIVKCKEKFCMDNERIFTRNIKCSALHSLPKKIGICSHLCVPDSTTECTEKGMSYSVPKELLLDINPRSFSLIDNNCKGKFNGTHLNFFSAFHQCGTKMKRGSKYVVYRNTVKNNNASSVISLRQRPKWTFSCSYLNERAISVTLVVKERPKINVLLQFTSKSGRILKKKKHVIAYPGKRVYVAVYATGLPTMYNIRTRVKNCFLADSPDLQKITEMHTLIRHSCPFKSDVHVMRLFNTGLWFSFPVFRSMTDKGLSLSLHCNAVLCQARSNYGSCRLQKCSL